MAKSLPLELEAMAEELGKLRFGGIGDRLSLFIWERLIIPSKPYFRQCFRPLKKDCFF